MTNTAFEKEIDESVEYLKSSSALKAVEADPYWPKWNSPLRHMLLLHEMGFNELVPKDLLKAYVKSLNRIPLKIFPIHPIEIGQKRKKHSWIKAHNF